MGTLSRSVGLVHTTQYKAMRLSLFAAGFLLLSLNCNAWDVAQHPGVFPAVYEAVLKANEEITSNTLSISTALDHIESAIDNDLSTTMTCLNSLDAKKGQECYDIASNYVNSRSKGVSAYVQQRFRNLFIPGYAKRSIGMMLFDASFKYWGELGWHVRNQEVILECAKRHCPGDSTAMAAELKKVKTDFDSSTGSKIGGQHYELDWSAMVDFYNQVSSVDTPGDNYNIWMPGEQLAIDSDWPALAAFHQFNFNTSQMLIPHEEHKCWFTAAKFAALHHFHYYFLFGPDRIFATAASNKPINEFLSRADSMLGPDAVESLDRQENFLDSISQARFSRGEKMTTMAHFQVKLHHAGKLYMLHRSNAYKTFIARLATPSSWVFGEGGLKYLGYEETIERLGHMSVFYKCITSIRFMLRIQYLVFYDQLKWIILFVVLPVCLLLIFTLCFVCKSLQCCCRGFRCCLSCIKAARKRRCWCLWQVRTIESMEISEIEEEEEEEEAEPENSSTYEFES